MWNSLEVAGGDTVNKVGMGTPVERREKKVKKNAHLWSWKRLLFYCNFHGIAELSSKSSTSVFRCPSNTA